MLSNLARCRGMMHLSDVSAEKWKHYYFKSALGPSLFSSASCCCLIELIQTYLISGVSASIYKPADEFETVCVCVCVSIFRERKSKEDTKQREHGYGTCAEHVCWQTCEAERQHTDQAVQMCVQKRKAFYSLFAGIFMCMAVCMRKEKK